VKNADPTIVADCPAGERNKASAAILGAVERQGSRIEVHTAAGPVVWRIWGEGEPLILVHGGGGAWTHWIRNIEALAATRRVFALDLPGCGESQFREIPTEPSVIARVVGETLSLVAGKKSGFDFIAFSFGAIVTASLAVLDPACVRSLILVGSVGLGIARRRPPIRMLRKISDPTARLDALKGNLAAMMIADPNRVDDLAAFIHDRNTRSVQLKSSAISATEPLAGLLPKMRCPVQAVWGRQDNLYPPNTDERVVLFGRLHHPSVPVFIDPGGHWVQYENPDAFNAFVLGHLAR
jgi:2-hydroxy-6-oxonona-2,4-dienedioate hydrolase